MVMVFLAACPKNTADLELEAARQAILDASRKKANDCAKETFVAAETAIRDARRLADEGDVEGAKRKAEEARTLADQANAASPPGCDESKGSELDDAEGRTDGSSTEDASASLALGGVVETVYFDYNDATIRADSKAMLSHVALLLVKDPAQKLEVEGHCDVRGSTEYNLHLGERRARSVEKYLTTQGAKSEQISIISYGEESPADPGDDETAHQKNRRAELKKR